MKTRRQITRRPRVEELESRLVPSTLTTSSNWSGYAVVTNPGAVTAVSGTWVVPTVQNTANGYSSAWVGIDGYNSNSVEQIGTEMDYSYGQAQYYAWYEMYPQWSVELPLAIAPGNTISATVAYTASSQYTLSLTDVTTGKSYTTVQKGAGLSRSSAEWIVEAPSNGYSILPLDNFGTIPFSNAHATIGGKTGAIDTVTGGSNVEQINMLDNQGSVTGDTTSSLSDSGSPATSSFSATATVTTTTPTPPPSGHHHRWWSDWWSPNVAILPAASLMPATGFSATAGTFNATAGRALPGSTTGATVATPVAAPAVTAATAQSNAALAGNSDPASVPPTVGSDKPASPELLPMPNVSDTPGGATSPQAPQNPSPSPSSDDLPAGLQGSAVDWRRTSEAFFTQQRWEPAPALDGTQAAAVKVEDEGSGSQLGAGAVALVALGGAWTIVVDQPATRRYKQRPI